MSGHPWCRPSDRDHNGGAGCVDRCRAAGRPPRARGLAPIGLVSGDQTVASELRARAPWVETVEVKQALSNVAADCIAPPRARELIQAGAARAIERAGAGELTRYTAEPAPYEIEIELRKEPNDVDRKNLEALPEFEWLDERTVATRAPDMDPGFRPIAYMGFAGTKLGLTRY